MNARLTTFLWIIVGALLAVAPPAARAELVDNGNGTITDTVSGLMWLKNADTNGSMDWGTANTWVQSLNTSAFAGHSDWRLPSGANRDGSGTVCNSAPSGANCTGTEFATLYFARLIMFGNPGPFQNLRAGSYWTATDAPGNPAQAMAQDFIDGGQNPFDKTRALLAWAVRDAGTIVLPPGTPLLYGVVSQAPNAGALILIDTQNAAVSIVGLTGFDQPCGLAFDRIRLKLYLSPCFGQAGLQVINPATGAPAPLGTQTTGVRSIAHRHLDDRIYGMDISPALLSLDTPTGGSDVAVLGIIAKQSTGGIAARPSDGKLFGVGMTASNSQQLFTLMHTSGSGPRDTNIGAVPAAPIRALTFHPDGRLFATDGKNLLTLDASNGAVLSRLAFSGASIGDVGGLAVTGPSLVAPVDVWLKDCRADTGGVPSSPHPCSDWRQSPDITIDNNNDGVPDTVVNGQTNIVRIIVRNRGQAPAQGVVVRLYAYTGRWPWPPGAHTISRVTLVGQRTVNVGTGRLGIAKALIPWRAPLTVPQAFVQCLIVVLDHPSDRANARMSPALDNNKAASCTQLR